MTRKRISKNLKYRIMYESQYVCAVCQGQGQGCQIHHIDGNNSNNEEENLILLCNTHHDEAHTNRQLSQNLNAGALRDAKEKWKDAVQEKRELAATVSGQLLIAKDSPLSSIGITWGYINHNRVAQLARPESLGVKEKQYFDYCRKRGILDQKGILIKPKGAPTSGSYVGNSIYDWYEHGDDLRLHMVYSAFVDQVSKSVHPVHLEPRSWTKARIRELLKPGSFIFLERAFYFKTVNETKANQHRHVRAFKRKISMEFYVDTINMFGTTSMTVSFSGHQSCAAMLQLKSIEEQDDGGLVLHCTPIALGVGFNKDW